MMAVIDDGRVIFGIPPLTRDRTGTLTLLAVPTDSSASFGLRLWSHETEDSPFCIVVFFSLF